MREGAAQLRERQLLDPWLTAGEWIRLRAKDEARAGECLEIVVRWAADRGALSRFDTEEVARETVYRIWALGVLPEDRGVRLDAWVCRVYATVRLRHREGFLRCCALDFQVVDPRPGPAELLRSRDAYESLRAQLRRAISTLPPPRNTIAYAIVILDVPRSDVVAHLKFLRVVSRARCHALIAQAFALLRDALSGVDLRSQHPQLFSDKNPWRYRKCATPTD